jgi:hypothetical protein
VNLVANALVLEEEAVGQAAVGGDSTADAGAVA